MSIVLPLKVAPGKPILRGIDFIWQQIRAAGKNGRHFTINEIDLAGNDRSDTVREFIRRLQKAGYIRQVARQAPKRPGTRGRAVLQLVRRPVDTPKLRRDGSSAGGDGQLRMWTAIRALKTFNATEIAVAASVEGGVITLATAKAYLKRLSAAGYLVAAVPGGPNRQTAWRLKPSMNTGAKAPLVLRTKIVWDANRGAVIGDVVAEEARP